MITSDSYYNRYITLAQGKTVVQALEEGKENATRLFARITAEKWNHRYAPGKWSVKELVQHAVDAERIFSYRALCFARGEAQNLPAFEEDDYAQNSFADYRNGADIAAEFDIVRQSTILLFKSFAPGTLARSGVANNTELTVEEIGLIIAGHTQHHLRVLEERYLAQ